MITKLHAICESLEQPIDLHVIAGQMSDHTGARALLSSPPNVKALLADRNSDADWVRTALHKRGCAPVFLAESRKKPRPNTTSGTTSGETASRSCSAGSGAGGAAMTDAPRYSFWPSLSRPLSSTDYEA
jgi:transposase